MCFPWGSPDEVAHNQIYTEDLRCFCYSGNYTWNVGHDFTEEKMGQKVLLKQ